MSLKEKIRDAKDLCLEKVFVADWGFDVWIRKMTGRERSQFEAWFVSIEKQPNGEVRRSEQLRGYLLVRVICDENGERVYGDDESAELMEKSSSAIEQLFEIAIRLNGVSKADVEEMTKNSDATHSNASV